jgi:hypothetical protein
MDTDVAKVGTTSRARNQPLNQPLSQGSAVCRTEPSRAFHVQTFAQMRSYLMTDAELEAERGASTRVGRSQGRAAEAKAGSGQSAGTVAKVAAVSGFALNVFRASVSLSWSIDFLRLGFRRSGDHG